MIFSTLSRNGSSFSFLQKKFVSRPFFQWLTIIFNKIDMTRIEEFGPDRVCAEWCLRNGAKVQWVGSEKMMENYNSLPAEGIKLYIKKIDATDSSISDHGFLHLRNCKHIREIIFKNCGYIENDALKLLSFVKDSLEHLHVERCGNITDTGLTNLKDLTNLKILKLYNLSYVKDKKSVLQVLRSNLPKCEIFHDFEGKKEPSNTN